MKLTYGLVTAVVLAGAAGPAMAVDMTGFYLGAGWGEDSWSIDKNNAANGFANGLANLGVDLTVNSSRTSTSATMWQGFVGYRFMPYLAAEAAYVSLGNATYNGQGTARFSTSVNPPVVTPPLATTVRARWNASGWPISVLGIWPINDQWDVFARAGVLFGTAKVVYSVSATNQPQYYESRSNNVNTNQFMGGLGVDYTFYDHMGARFDWQYYNQVGNKGTGSGDINGLLLSLFYKF